MSPKDRVYLLALLAAIGSFVAGLAGAARVTVFGLLLAAFVAAATYVAMEVIEFARSDGQVAGGDGE